MGYRPQKGDRPPEDPQNEERVEGGRRVCSRMQPGDERGHDEVQQRGVVFEVVPIGKLALRNQEGAVRVLEFVRVEAARPRQAQLEEENREDRDQEGGRGQVMDPKVQGGGTLL